MEVEVKEIARFLGGHEPWSGLPAATLDDLLPRLRQRYFRRGSVVLAEGQRNDSVFVIRSGVVDITSGGVLVERADVGTAIGVSSATTQTPSAVGLLAVEDTLVLVVPGETFRSLLGSHEPFAAFFDRNTQRRLARAVAEQQHRGDPSSSALNARVGDLGHGRAPVTASAELSIRRAAEVMTEQQVSALLVTDEERLVGIVTDRDLRTKVVAAGLDPGSPIRTIMTADPVTVSTQTRAFEAMLQMTNRRIHHLPVVHEGRAVGMVSTGDLVRLERAHPVHIAQDVARQSDVDGIAAVAARVPGIVSGYVQQGASADEIGRVLTAIADAISSRLLTLLSQQVTADLGEAPRRWCWLALGSQARYETGLSSDQDHALVVSDEAIHPDGGTNPEAAADGPDVDPLAWYAALAERMEAALAACGYPPCPGRMMASNPRWRLTQTQWRHQFLDWLDTPTSEALFHAGTFFDARPLFGEHTLFDPLQRLVAETAPERPRFLTHLAAHATLRQPPLGFLGNLVVERRGDHSGAIDLKAGGSHAIIELARVHALSAGITEVSTDQRLARLGTPQGLGAPAASELRDAFEFITQVRLRHQAQQVSAGEPPSNLIDPQALSRSDRRHLRDAFGVIRSAQTVLAQRFATRTVT
ncbi:putative nucleotidyltransferase substrate binding domain-containing protein [Aestuariimicrobium kwangyangense]|uniref:putative nucleotidyltransferase substrate binding domain-containing protein n=1 Tax=Aestuariimicrobium kwangyangense TaxID=396389 RepID=UPI0003B62ADB|nr:putative nucleotidyltransferase substrate binding domain-containing protein [Aestuariimicrobium kwangyangense]